VKPVREPDDRNGHVRFDERGGETERWASRRERPRKVLLALGAAGPARHRAPLRLYQLGGLQDYLQKANPGKNVADIQSQTQAAREIARTEVWSVIDQTK
jgi:hypothetical protein